VSVGLYLIDTSGMFRILQGELRKAWSDQLAAGVIAVCPIVELEFLYSTRPVAGERGITARRNGRYAC